jgi:dihydropyrimidinase
VPACEHVRQVLIRGGTVVREGGVAGADVLVEGEKIADVRPDIEAAGHEVVDAGGLLVLPGVVDPHTHFLLDTGTARTVDDFESASIAAAAGGVTSYIDFAAQRPGQTFHEVVQRRREQVEGHSHIDFGTHLSLAYLYEGWERDLERVVNAGVTSAKVYTTYKGTFFYVDDWTWLRLMQRSGDAGLLVQVHAENDDILEGRKQELLRAGKKSFAYHAQSRPAIAESEAVSRGLFFSRTTGSPVYFVHLSNPLSVDLVTEARSGGVAAVAETCPHFLALDDSVYAGPDASRYVMTPPLRDRSLQDGMWKRVEAGKVHTMGSDHCGFALSQREGMDDFTQASPGIPGVETSLTVLYSQGVAAGRLGPSDLVRLLCSNPARVFGLWPRKGDLAKGFDADIVLYDPRPRWTLRDEDVHSRAGYSPYAGLEMTGRVSMTICRGRPVWRDGRTAGEPGWGRYLERRPFETKVAAGL